MIYNVNNSIDFDYLVYGQYFVHTTYSVYLIKYEFN